MENLSVTRNAMVLLAIVMFETALATHALAAEHGNNGVHAGGGFQGRNIDGGFRGPVFDRAPSMPPPVFNPSNPYTVPQSPESPVSPASPGSIFGNR